MGEDSPMAVSCDGAGALTVDEGHGVLRRWLDPLPGILAPSSQRLLQTSLKGGSLLYIMLTEMSSVQKMSYSVQRHYIDGSKMGRCAAISKPISQECGERSYSFRSGSVNQQTFTKCFQWTRQIPQPPALQRLMCA